MQRSALPWKASAAAFVLMLVFHQVCSGPVLPHPQAQWLLGGPVQAVKRVARMTPLWRILNSKPYGAYCQNHYECSTGICRAGHCSWSVRDGR